MGVVYCITNKLNNKVYIGSTSKPFRRRKSAHISALNKEHHSNIHLQRAWKKYGQGVFNFIMVDQVTDPLELLQHEQTWLDLHRMNGNVYNIALRVTNTTLGTKRTKEQREHLSRIRTGPNHPMYGKHFSGEALRNIVASRKPMHGESNPMYGRKHSKETRKKLSRKARERMTIEGARENIAEKNSRPYPAFYNVNTDEVIPAGRNLAALCRDRKLDPAAMRRVKIGTSGHHYGWVVKDGI